MFKGARGTGDTTGMVPPNTAGNNWNPMKGQFNEIRSTDDPATGKPFQFYDYGTILKLQQQTDLTVAGALQDCNECHVGGGAMEYLPAGGKQFTSALLALNSRTPLRNIATAAPGTVNGGDAITAANITTFNYFLDSFDVDGDGNKGEMLYNDYAKTGVGEVDCLMCHLDGYSWDERKDMIRKAKHDAARAVGAGIATNNALAAANDTMPVGYGTTVGAYDINKVVNNGDGVLKLATTFADKIKKTPPSANCASCHFGTGFTIAEGGDSKVDVKKRGDHWVENANWDVHTAALECMDCHYNPANEGSRDANGALIYDANGLTNSTGGKTGAQKATGVDLVNNNTGEAVPDGLTDDKAFKVDMTGPDAGKLGMCDPGHKSGNFVGVWNAKDSNPDATSCKNCHDNAGSRHSLFPNAIDPAAAHAAAGLTAINVQDPYDTATRPHTAGVANASHIDIISCSACHIRKLEHFAGGAYLDSSGRDEEGHLVDHENKYTLRDMFDSSIPIWYKGQIRKSSVMSTLLWVDNNANNVDANQDGLDGALDVIMPSQTVRLNDTNNRGLSLTHQGHGVVTPDDISARQMDIFQGLDGLIGEVDKIWPQINFMHAAFVMDHGVSRADVAWGVKGCQDCHSPYTVNAQGERTAGGFYNGAYPLKAKEGTYTFNSGFVNGYNVPAAAGQLPADTSACTPPAAMDPNCYGNQPSYMQVAPFYMVNNMTENTNFHPYLYERGTKAKDVIKQLRSLPVDTTSTYQAYGPTQLRDVDRSEMLYENSFKKFKANPWSADGGTITSAPVYVPNALQGDSNRGYMLTVMVKDVGAADSTGIRRTLMKANNNPANETIPQLIGGFKMSTTGTYAETPSWATGYGFTISDAGSGKLSIVADPGKQVRIVETMSRFGFGFAGFYVTPMGVQYDPAADAIYEVNPIVATNNGGSYATRESWVKYLDSIGAATAAPITAPAGSPASAVKGVALTFTGNTTGLNVNNKYKWDMGNGVTFEGVGPAFASKSYAYPVEGTYTAKLYVTAPTGGTPASSAVTVKVAAVAAPSWTAVYDDTIVETPTDLPPVIKLANLPATTTKVYVVWDDGLKTNQVITAGTTAVSIPHAYKRIAQRLVDVNPDPAVTDMKFVFNTVVRIYDAGGVLLGTKSVPVSIAP